MDPRVFPRIWQKYVLYLFCIIILWLVVGIAPILSIVFGEIDLKIMIFLLH